MRYSIFLVVGLMATGASFAADKTIDLSVERQVWAKTVVTPYDDSSNESRDATFKVYTHLMDFAGKEAITKGLGGQFPHHRGLFIGWRKTHVGDKQFDTWHMTDCYQKFTGTDGSAEAPSLAIEWRGNDGTLICNEKRTITPSHGPNGSRIFDFTSELSSDAEVQLRGDSHHAGMQVRLSNEMAENKDPKTYVLPEGAKRLDNDEVSGAWWAVCNATIGGKKYSVMHMTPPDNPTGIKLYSIRPYARFGAFFEPDVKKGVPLVLTFRIVVSELPIDQTAANALYQDYAGGRAK